ncbi:MAG: Gx transporter family protein [Coriobacteriales bacterium]|nr:Gx transporter family protein [Coriobacteriales bacterium]
MSERSQNKRTRDIAYIALLASLTLALGYIESTIPLPVTIPGVKLGLANITVLVALCLLGPRWALSIMLLKVLMVSVISGSPSMVFYSLSGSMLAYGSMLIGWRVARLNVTTISIIAAILHNLGQISIAALIMQTPLVFLNFPVMVVAACITGSVTGMVAAGVLKALSENSQRHGTTKSNAV